MTKLPVRRARDIVAALRRAGFEVIHQTGSHMRLRRIGKPTRNVTIPFHAQDIPQGTLKQILEQAGMSVEELIKLL